MRYVALLRGINVGGNTMIRMAELRTSFESLGLENVVTYINSGNLGFDSPKMVEDKLVKKLEKAIETDFGLTVGVIVRERTAFADVLANNPFDGQFESHKQMHVLFMSGNVPADKQAEILSSQTEKEQVAIRGREIYLLLLGGMAESLLGRGLIERKLKMPMTARNWRTVQKLAEL
jgi:uncharacterized protein (DUF1697 family)